MSKEKSQKSEEVYKHGSLARYSLRERIVIRLAGLIIYALVYLIGKTIRFEKRGWENYESIEQNGKTPILAFWHNRIFLSTYYFRHRGIIVMSSQSFDSEYIARFIQRFGFGVVRGSSTRGGVGALIEMIKLMRKGLPMGFSVDGPKGPKYVAKSGACMLAKKTQNPVVPFIIEVEKYWEVKNWDNMQIPKPFSRACVYIAEPFYVAKDAADEEIEKSREELQIKLDELVMIGENWRENNSK
ncbi:MAG: lysophospholipid acyltransferase family protein [Acidobacteriota bacterium]|nr:lysophospholipid acyltransferase family protein [Acidobacteriota bacterium]